MANEKIKFNLESVDKIKSRVKAIKLMSKDKEISKLANEVIELLEHEIEENSISLMEKIELKMRESKFSDPELNANLYMVYRNLMDDKISEKDAEEMYQLYVKSESFDKKIY